MQNNQLSSVSSLLKSFPCIGLKTPSILKFLALSKELEDLKVIYDKNRTEILTKYDVNLNDRDISEKLQNNPDLPKIVEELTNFDKKEVELTQKGFLSQDQALNCIEQMSTITLSGVEELLKLLVTPEAK